MLNNTKGIIFDLDGTLVDSMWIWKDIDIEYLGNLGLTLPDSLQDDVEGMSYTETAAYFKETFCLPHSLEEIKEEWTAMAKHKYSCEVPLKEGVKEFLDFGIKNELKMGIATSNGKDLVTEVLNSHHLFPYFQSVRTSCEVAAGKPSPDIYLKVAEDMALSPSECLVFEDIPNGILAGKRAGMKVCAIDDAFSMPLKEKKKQLADFYIHNYYDIFQETYEVLS